MDNKLAVDRKMESLFILCIPVVLYIWCLWFVQYMPGIDTVESIDQSFVYANVIIFGATFIDIIFEWSSVSDISELIQTTSKTVLCFIALIGIIRAIQAKRRLLLRQRYREEIVV